MRRRVAVMFETTVAVVGTVLSEPRIRETPGGERVVSFRLAGNSRRYDKEAEKWVDGDRLIVTVHCWRRVADGVIGVVGKTTPVLVSGRLYTREYESAGGWRTSVEVEAAAVGLDLARGNRIPGAADRLAAELDAVKGVSGVDQHRRAAARSG